MAKSKKGKQERHETQMKRVYNLVANNTPDGHFSLLNYTGISEVKKGDIKWLKMAMEKKMFTESVTSEIKSLIDPQFLSLFDDSSSDEDDLYEIIWAMLWK